MRIRTLREKGKTFIVLPVEDYEKLLEKIEMAEDVRAYDEAKAKKEEPFPMSIFDRIDSGENPVRVFREYRALTLRELGQQSCISESYLSQIESGKRKGTAKILKNIAAALNVDLELIF